jgi:hypothetical protein
MRKSSKFLGALAVAGLIAAGGSAYTASNTMATAQVVGYGSTTISGATVNSMAYTLNDTGTNVNSVTLVLDGDMTLIPSGHTVASAVSIGFNALATTPCGTGTLTWATDPVAEIPATETKPLVPAVPGVGPITTYTCDNGGVAFVQTTAGLMSTHIVVN